MENIRQRAVLAGLHVSLPTGKKQDREVSDETCLRHGAKEKTVKVSKQILPKDSLEPLRQHVQMAREYYKTNTLPFYDGRRFLPNSHFLTFTNGMRGMQETYKTLASVFLGNYESCIEQAKSDLQSLFKQADYPTLREMHERFDWQLVIEPIPTGADIRIDLSEAELATLQKDLENRITASVKSAQLDLYRRLFEPLSKMVERLSNPEAKFRDSLVSNLQEVCEVIPKLSLDDDLELAGLVDAARQLAIHSPDVLRDDTRVRSDVARRAQEITERMAAYFPGSVGVAEVAA